jgi:hypothetical protein
MNRAKTIAKLLSVACAVGFALGCEQKAPSAAISGNAPLGRFEGEVIAVWDTDGRNMTLRQDFAYIDSQERRWLAPANSVINGASIPQGFWSLIGGPFEGRYRNASVVHDVGCHRMTESWEDVHQMFYEACLAGGVEETQAKMMYYAVYHFGPRWQTVSETGLEMQQTSDGRTVAEPVTYQFVARNDPVPPTPDEVAQVTAFIGEDQPTVAAIQNTTRDVLHQRRRRHGGNRSGSAHWHSPRAADATLNPDVQLQPQGPLVSQEADSRDDQPAAQRISSEERDWVTRFVQAHLDQQAGEPVPAQFRVRRIANGYSVFVQYWHYDEQGQAIQQQGGRCLVRLSPRGEILEVRSGP